PRLPGRHDAPRAFGGRCRAFQGSAQGGARVPALKLFFELEYDGHNMSRKQIWIIAAAGLVFALIFGVRQSVALFIGPLNTATGLGIAAISLAFACAQLMWGITQPIAGAVADKYGTGRVIAVGAVLVMLGTVLTPHATSTWMLVLLIGVVAAGGGGMAGLGVLMSAVARALPPEKRGIASGMVNAGGSFGQFVVAPLAIVL